jgi:hypothetical protein
MDLTNGGFSGTLPTELGLMTNLKFLFLSKNAIHGTVPSELGNLNMLGKLNEIMNRPGHFVLSQTA